MPLLYGADVWRRQRDSNPHPCYGRLFSRQVTQPIRPCLRLLTRVPRIVVVALAVVLELLDAGWSHPVRAD